MDKATVRRIRFLLLLTLAGLFIIGVVAGPYGVPDHAWVKVTSATDCYFRVIVDDDKNTIPQPSLGDFPGWCTDIYHLISPGSWHYASLTVKLTTEDNWGKINWILNHKNDPCVINWKVIQGAIWRVLYPDLTWTQIKQQIQSLPASYPLNSVEENKADELASKAQSDFMPGEGDVVAVYVDPGQCVQKFIFEYPIPSGGGGVPEFGEGVPAIASLTLVSYVLLKRRLKAN